jgi:TatD DNase family protein
MVRLLIPSSLGTELNSEGAFRIAPDLPWADLAIGIHPYSAVADAPCRDTLLQRANDARVVAIGETGIDTKRLRTTCGAYLENLEAHIDVAAALGKPLIWTAVDSEMVTRRSESSGSAQALGDRCAGRRNGVRGRVPFILHSASLERRRR